MSNEQREQARLTILRYLDAAADTSPGRGIPSAVLMQHLRAEGFSGADRILVGSLLMYLVDRGLVVLVDKAVSPEVAAWRITAAGRDYYASAAA